MTKAQETRLDEAEMRTVQREEQYVGNKVTVMGVWGRRRKIMCSAATIELTGTVGQCMPGSQAFHAN